MKNNLSQKIIEKIKKEKIKMKPRWWFNLKDEAKKSVMALLLLASSLLLSLVIYQIQLVHPEELINYGEIGMEVFIEEFPYLILSGTVILLAGSAFVLARVGDNYKRATTSILRLTSGIILAASLLLTIIRMFFEK